MRLSGRVKTLERTALIGGGMRCPACGLPRHGWPVGTSLVAVGPASVRRIDDIAAMAAEPIQPPCGVCGRARAFRIPAPERARSQMEDAA